MAAGHSVVEGVVLVGLLRVVPAALLTQWAAQAVAALTAAAVALVAEAAAVEAAEVAAAA